MARAVLLLRSKLVYPDGAVREIVIWQLSRPTPDRPHGVKYRCHYSAADGRVLVRYDNETGKGDHVHRGKLERAYRFRDVERLLEDFASDVELLRKESR